MRRLRDKGSPDVRGGGEVVVPAAGAWTMGVGATGWRRPGDRRQRSSSTEESAASPPRGRPRPLRLAFEARPSDGRVALRPAGPAPTDAALPRDVGPGEGIGGLAFADLAEAFGGVIEVDRTTGAAAIVERAPDGPPYRIAFALSPRGDGSVVLRALGGHAWTGAVPAGEPVFGLPPEVLAAVRKGVLALDPGTLEACLEGEVVARPACRGLVRRSLLAKLAAGLALIVAAVGVAGWWSGRPEAPPFAAAVERRPAVRPPADALAALQALAAGTNDPALRADLAGIAEALRGERQARERERALEAGSVVEAGAQLARAYRRDVADMTRLRTALAACGAADDDCTSRFAPAVARAEAARVASRDAYVDLLRQAAERHAQVRLAGGLADVEVEHGRGGELDDLAERFVAQVDRVRRDGSAPADREALVRELGPGRQRGVEP